MPPARDQPIGSPSTAGDATVAGFTAPVTVESTPLDAAGARRGFFTLTSGVESAAATVVPATGARGAWLTGDGDRSTGLTAPRATEPVCEPSTAAGGTVLSPGKA